MERPKVWFRIDPINIAYLNDLAKVGAYGRGKSGVMRRFVQNGIVQALESGLITKRSIEEFGGKVEDEEDDN